MNALWVAGVVYLTKTNIGCIMMSMKLYNTMSRKKEEFVAIDGNRVRMYSCGPTVYGYAHIGNLRAYVFVDTLRRVLLHNGYTIQGVLNITDVGHLTDDGDDKLDLVAKKEKVNPLKIADRYTKAFFDDLEKLGIHKPEIIAKATDHIEDMLSMCEKLFDMGFAYETNDGVYFDTTKFPSYGALSRTKLDGNIAGARIAVGEKRNATDFALWKKAANNHIMKWDSRWGQSYPGWHIECSAMAHKYLGEHFDIHTGGVDHIPIHHENEIAQTEAYTGKRSVNFWMHNEFMQVDGGKMSKSLGNTYTLDYLAQKGFEPMVYRLFLHSAHYRKKINFTWDALCAVKVSYSRLLETLYMHKCSTEHTAKKVLDKYKSEFFEAVNDDMNTPLGLGILHTMLKLPYSNDVYNAAIVFDSILGLSLEREIQCMQDKAYLPVEKENQQEIPQEIRELAERRLQAKKSKDFVTADKIRQEITDKGFAIVDIPNGYTIHFGFKKC